MDRAGGFNLLSGSVLEDVTLGRPTGADPAKSRARSSSDGCLIICGGGSREFRSSFVLESESESSPLVVVPPEVMSVSLLAVLDVRIVSGERMFGLDDVYCDSGESKLFLEV